MESFRGRETTAKALGQEWRFARWTRNVFDDFNAWARTKLPNPLEVAEAQVLKLQMKQRDVYDGKAIGPMGKALTDEDKKFLIDAYQEQADRLTKAALDKAASYLAMNSPEYQSLIGSHLGTAKLFHLLMLPAHPDVTEEQAFEIVQNLPPDEIGRIMNTTSGKGGGSSGNGSCPAANTPS